MLATHCHQSFSSPFCTLSRHQRPAQFQECRLEFPHHYLTTISASHLAYYCIWPAFALSLCGTVTCLAIRKIYNLHKSGIAMAMRQQTQAF
ncbi:uncharacterized protein BJX67DRAFT_366264 [Aspergillus lucknowensis]|uniref:Uncharacterized protein n=1 Tax=Aspergillus lucknowensis TaxID=176173 RepID=A0ABR4LD18_9EURO